jgi:UDP-N-acetylmuramoyl-tripeptide--D-alanyl-D-alanine ligase
MTEFAFQDILDSTGAVLLAGDARRRVRGVSTDTRTLHGEELFLALDGPNFNGNGFAGEALRRGASGLVLRRDQAEGLELRQADGGLAPIALHESPRRALAELAAWHRERLSASVVGITGSCGKTTTKNILVSLLEDLARVVGSPASFNNDIGVPLTLLQADTSTEVLVVEMGTNQAGEIANLCRVTRPNAGVVTNVGASHLAGLGSVEGVAREKGELVASLPATGFCVLNADCRFTPLLRSMSAARVITFSVDGDALDSRAPRAASPEMHGGDWGGGDLNATDVWFHAGGTNFKLNGTHEVTSPLLGLHNVQNLLAALCTCVGLGFDLERVLPAVSRLRPSRRRLERIEVGGMVLFDDSYNANPESARASVRVLAGFHGHARRVLVLGDMLELGDFSAELHHGVGRLAAEAGLDLVVLVGELSRATAAGALEGGLAPDRVLHFDDTDQVVQAVPQLLREGDVVLVKGSRRLGLDRVVEGIRSVGV